MNTNAKKPYRIDPTAYYRDCFALATSSRGGANCGALNDMYCITEPGKVCPFYQSKKSREEKVRKE